MNLWQLTYWQDTHCGQQTNGIDTACHRENRVDIVNALLKDTPTKTKDNRQVIDNTPVYDTNAVANTQSVNARLGLEQISLPVAHPVTVATVHVEQLTTNMRPHLSQMTLGIGQIDVTDNDETDTEELY